MLEINEKHKCCGCYSCVNACPQSAISMKQDEKGFEYPEIDKSKCIECGLCEKVCPILSKSEGINKTIKKAYACYNKRENERLQSSSGGVFILIAKEIIKKNGVVFGACFDDEFSVKHDYVEEEDKLCKFMCSKYVQSIIGNSYCKAKEFLDQGRYVLFTGTPCQIEGLKKYLRKDYEKLYTQDIICHGVPSPMVWRKYLAYRQNVDKDSPTKISFRNKDNGWKLFNMKFSYNNKDYKNNQNNDLYMQAFLKNTILRDSCYNCSFKKIDRQSDITLADYWGIDKVNKKMDDDKGTSLVILNSSKGESLFNEIKNNLEYEDTSLDDAIRYNTAYTQSARMDKNRDSFFENIENMEFDKLVKKYTYKRPLYKRVIGKAKKCVKNIIGRVTN